MDSKYGYNESGHFVNLVTGLPPTDEEKAVCDKAHAAMVKTDGAFQSALETKYRNRAGDMRYRTDELPPSIKALAIAYQNAVEDWRNTWRRN